MTALTSGAALDLFETLDSTSLEAKRRAEAGERGPRWFIALSQTGGYGRRGRAWAQAPGDFAGTLLFDPALAGMNWPQLPLIAGLAAASALDDYVPAAVVTLKWPNDILLNNAKAVGVLLERIGPDAAPLIAMGIGVNIVSAPKDAPYPTARLVDYAKDDAPSPAELAAAIDRHFWTYCGEMASKGAARIRELWLARAAGVGGRITVRLPQEEISGVFEGLDENGALILRSDAGKRIISAGEVFF